jgi:transcriptional regulator with XRE-family HTH domain
VVCATPARTAMAACDSCRSLSNSLNVMSATFSNSLNGVNKLFAKLTNVLDLSAFFYQAIKDAGLSQAKLGELLGLSGGSFVNQVLKGTSPLPEDQVDEWAKHLKLDDAGRQTLWDLWAIAQIPPQLRGRFYLIYERFHAAESRVEAVEKRIHAVSKKDKRDG